MKYLNCFYALSLAALVGCKPDSPAVPPTKSYSAHGIVRQISTDRHSAKIQHDAIAGYMPAMTMDFNVKDTNELKRISPSDEITFKLVVNENDSWIEGIHFESHVIEDLTNNTVIIHMPTAELKPGDLLPDCSLTAEDGNKIQLTDFRGKALAFTFFYSRCPLPDYCPRMSKNLSEARKLILDIPNAPTNWQLLSISFDPQFDNPAVLTSYANFYRSSDASHWLFAVASTNTIASLAPQLDLEVLYENEGITHNLRTVVLDPQGRIFRQLDGNKWTPQQLADAILTAAKTPVQ